MQGWVMMALGGYRFALGTAAYQKLDRTSEWRWPTLDVIGAPPAAQYIGPGHDKISLDGSIFPHFRGGLGQIDAMRGQAGRGQPLVLVSGYGKFFGQYVITSIKEGQQVFFSDGAPRRMEFGLELMRYA